ncbi:MAG TPA: hypothetical protein VFY93_03970 [Planctomycetota bacterium]|nr:hypothetical protein [Planctomycetota bacterium]
MGISLLHRGARRALLLLALACAAATAQEGSGPPPLREEATEPPDLPPDAAPSDAAAAAEAAGKEQAAPETPKDESAAAAAAAEQEKAREKAVRWEVEGYLYEQVQYENASGEASDNDLDSRTGVLLDAMRGEEGWHVRLNAMLHWDMAGQSGPNDPLRDFWDQFDGDAQGRLYELFVDLPRFGRDDEFLLRVGRQYLEEEVFLQFDGGRLDIDLGKSVDGLNVSIIGGVPVYFPEESREGDWLVGVVARGKISGKARGRISYYHVSQNFDGINDPVVDPGSQAFVVPAGQVDDDLLALSVWVDLPENFRFYGMFDFLEWDPNELQLQLRWFSSDTRWTVIAQYDELFDRLVNVANELSPYVPLLGAYQPFLLASIRANYRPSEQWVVLAGISYRTLEDDSDEGTFNHEYWQYQAGATRLGLLEDRLDATLTVNGYSSDAGPDVFAFTGNVDYHLNTKVSIAAGIDYAYYKYFVQQGTEADNVWTYYVNVEWEIRPKMELDAGISVDVDDLFTYTQLTLRFTVRF